MPQSCDVLVIGGGTAGAVIAARLSQETDRTVVLVESGPHYQSREATPPDLLDGYHTIATTHDWDVRARTANGAEVPYLRGKVTGGSSAINGAIALRGAPEDFDTWADLGNDLWSWNYMLDSFRRLEDDRDYGDDYHGKGGPIPISRWRPDELSVFAARFQQALIDSGHPAVADHNAPAASGAGPLPMNLDGRIRVSTSLGYLGPAQSRVNLTILPGHTARQLNFEGQRVIGARVTQGGGEFEIRASETILAAGAIHSPALLLRSGIGEAEVLRRLGVQCHADLPGVGHNLVEHPTTLIRMVNRAADVPIGSDALVQIASRFTSPGSSEVNDLQLFGLNGLSISGLPQLQEQLGVDSISSIGSSVQCVSSAGAVTLEPARIHGTPRVDFNCFAADVDVARGLAGVREAWRIATSPPMSEFWQVVTPLTSSQVEDDKELTRFIKNNVNPHYHACGSCRMGPDSDPAAVVDQQLRVRGVDGLRVIDASIMPTIPRANTNLTTIAIAEHGVKLLDA